MINHSQKFNTKICKFYLSITYENGGNISINLGKDRKILIDNGEKELILPINNEKITVTKINKRETYNIRPTYLIIFYFLKGPRGDEFFFLCFIYFISLILLVFIK